MPEDEQMKARFKWNKIQRNQEDKQQKHGSFRNKLNDLTPLELSPDSKSKRPSTSTPMSSWFKKTRSVSNFTKKSNTNEELKHKRSIDRKSLRLFKRKKIKTKNYVEHLEAINNHAVIKNQG